MRAAIHTAADEKSPGTSTSAPCSSCPPKSEIVEPVTVSCPPKYGSIRSVWSRLSMRPRNVVRPSLKSAANRIALFTCALATGSV